MLPIVLVAGFLAGIGFAGWRARLLAVLVLGLAWAAVIGDLGDAPLAFALGLANGAIGVAVGTTVQLAVIALARPRSAA